MGEPLIHIGEVIVNGVVFDPKNGERLRTMDLARLLESVPRLFDLLDERQVDYVLVGGIAMLVYVKGRNTQDIDLLVPRAALVQLPELRIEEENPDFAVGWFDQLRVDLLFTRNPLFEQVRKVHTTMKGFAGRQVRCATVEGILKLKLFALPSLYRQARFEKVDLYQHDLLVLMRKFQPEMQPLLDELGKHLLSSDVAKLRKIVTQIETEIARSRLRFGSNGASAACS